VSVKTVCSSRRALLAASAALLHANPSWAARPTGAFPARTVRLVVPYSVGIGPDVVARSVAEQLSQLWDQTVLVDNKPGASGIVAFADVRRTAADGHTLYLADSGTLAVNPLVHASLPYDPVRDLEPLTLLFRATFVLWVGGGSRLRSVAELQDAARRTPGSISYASLGNGHPSQVAVESFAHAAGLRLLHVPFKDGGTLFAAVASGEVDFTAFSINTMAPLMASGKLRPLAIAARERVSSHPSIPTLVEAGGPAVEMHPWAALMTVAGTPAPVLAALQQGIGQALASDAVRKRAENAGFEITPSSPQAVRERMQADSAMVRPLIAAGRIARY
jgi:tripartite-type tricarboxylate transporter receptor subunit TctC